MTTPGGSEHTPPDALERTPPADVCQVHCFHLDAVVEARSRLPDDQTFERASSLFSALADKTRLKILHALSGGNELCVCDVAEALDLSVATASHHLRKLRDAKILKHRPAGKLVYYSLSDPSLAALLWQALDRGDRERATRPSKSEAATRRQTSHFDTESRIQLQ